MDIALHIAAGTCGVVLGPHDAGKSTLLDVVAGHRRTVSGALALDGREIGALAAGSRGIGMVSARDPLFAHLDVAGQLDLPLKLHGVAREARRHRVAQMLALLGLEDVARRRPQALDPARRLRAALGRATVVPPALLLLDEPFAGIETTERPPLRLLLHRLRETQAMTLLVATADRETALQLGGTIAVMAAGRIHQSGDAATLFEAPADALVARQLGEANILPGRVLAIEDDQAEIRLASGAVVTALPAPGLEADMLCDVAVQPSRIAAAFTAGTPHPGAAGDLAATLIAATHHGDHLRLRFRTADGTEVLVRRPAYAGWHQMRAARPALLAWQATHAIAFPQT